MTYRAVIFDIDGTLLNTLTDIADSTNAALNFFGFPGHEVNTYRYFIGDGVDALALRALPENKPDPAIVNKLVTRIAEEYSRRFANNTHPYPGIPELLDALTRHSIHMAILSNKEQGFAEISVSKLLEQWHFDIVIGVSPSVPKKPDPTGALRIASQMKLDPSEFIYVGDSGVDIKTASAAGMYPVGALWGFRTTEELLANGAKMLAKKPQDVLQLINGE